MQFPFKAMEEIGTTMEEVIYRERGWISHFVMNYGREITYDTLAIYINVDYLFRGLDYERFERYCTRGKQIE